MPSFNRSHGLRNITLLSAILIVTGCMEVNSGHYYSHVATTQDWACHHKRQWEQCTISKSGAQIDLFVHDPSDNTWYGLGIPMIPGKSVASDSEVEQAFVIEVHITAPTSGTTIDLGKTFLNLPSASAAPPSRIDLIWASTSTATSSSVTGPISLAGNEQRNYKLIFVLPRLPDAFGLQFEGLHIDDSQFVVPSVQMQMKSGVHYDLISPGP